MRSSLKALAYRLAPQLIALVVILLLNFITSPQFFNVVVQNDRLYGSLIDVLNRGAPVALLAIGMTLVIATKGIDLSVGAVIAICGAVAASSIVSGNSVAYTIILTLAIGLACGVWNGFLVAVLNIQPIIATLVLMVAGRGIAQLITEGAILTFNNDGLTFFGSGSLALLPMPVVIWLLVGLLVILLVRRTALGMLIEAVGINRRASTLSGIQTPVLLMAVYMLSGLCASIAGIIVAADIKGADANNAGLWLELDAILAVVVGGNSLLGGRFSILGSLIGAMIIQAVNTGILSAGFPPEFNLIIKAVIIIVILVIQSPAVQSLAIFASRRQGREQPK
ncbi:MULTISPECIES: ABC transporter permease [Rhizobium]|uniref:ABC transporter permease n=1 Tax=Rhizobium TaxID=379 RepID=UPI0010409ABE|nr:MULTISPECIES: ABC transporter permease [Rhizobium]MBY3183557.1 ABC transporter permease [Rhizobium laguerreae]MBY3220270.1 ABC transporter permease [Rhizobium laguerreae]MBY3235922.1 ABC transporter permease [Rhizobium laguerreae]MDU0307274.1 ABC transporter permease [Rhizobium sp. 10PS4]NKM24138.1 ABC transporter permease [Rhizobium laguerreae]